MRTGRGRAPAVVLVVVALTLAGCTGQREDRPPPPEFVVWMDGAPVLATKLVPTLAERYLESRSGLDVKPPPPDPDGTVSVTGIVDDVQVVFAIRATSTTAAVARAAQDRTDGVVMAVGDPAGPSSDGEIVIARDAVVPVVPDDSSLRALTLRELRDVFTCRVTTWPRGFGAEGPVTAVAPDDIGGTGVISERLLDGAELCDAVLRAPDGPGIASAVAGTDGSIGLVGSSAAQEEGVLALAVIDGDERVDATAGTIANGTYPLVRDLTLLVQPNMNPLLGDFLRFVTSVPGQDIVRSAGFVPPDPTTEAQGETCGDDVPGLCDFVEGAEDVGFAVRFATDEYDVDDAAVDELIARLIDLPEGGVVLLAGFADDRGTEAANDDLSRSRAAAVAERLVARLPRLRVEHRGFGERPLRSTMPTDDERQTSRSVETFYRAP